MRLASENRPQRLLERLSFDAALEAAAFRRLAELKVEACRTAFGKLVAGLDLSAPEHRREAILLMLDLLQKVNRRVHRPSTDERTYQEERAILLRQFGTYVDPEQARREFMPALTRLLAPLVNGRRAGHPLVERARSVIDQSYNHRLSLSSVAQQLHVSSNYLSRLFRRATGMTITAYIHRVRLEHARLLLAEHARSLSEIAYLVGYQNYRDFYRNFVKYERASPREAQRQLAPPGTD